MTELPREQARVSDPILLLPGFDGTGKLFAGFRAAIGDPNRVSVAAYCNEVVLDDYVESVATLLPAEPCVLIAESFSGPIAIALMQQHPARIKKAVLCATFLVAPFRFLSAFARFLPARAMTARIPAKQLLAFMCLNGEPQECIERALEVLLGLPARTIQQRLALLSRIDMRRMARNIRTPTFVVQPTRDRLVSKARYLELIEALPFANSQKIAGPHLLLQAKPNECWDHIREFIDCDSAHEAGSTT